MGGLPYFIQPTDFLRIVNQSEGPGGRGGIARGHGTVRIIETLSIDQSAGVRLWQTASHISLPARFQQAYGHPSKSKRFQKASNCFNKQHKVCAVKTA